MRLFAPHFELVDLLSRITLDFAFSLILFYLYLYIYIFITSLTVSLMPMRVVLQSCLDDFTHHNIDVACNLLETCGRFLYRFPETSLRMGNMLEIIMRLKNVKNLDARHSTLVENAYYQCKPPERSARVSKVRPPLHQVVNIPLILRSLFSSLSPLHYWYCC